MGSVSSEEGWKIVLSQSHETEENEWIEEKELIITDKTKEFWKGITKKDILNYYFKIFPLIITYLKNRPLGLNVSIYGVEKEGIFLRGMEGNHPQWASTFKTQRKNPKKGKSEYIHWLVCNDLATLIYIVNLGCIDLHPWNSQIKSPNNPDYIVIDLDPSDNDFTKVINTTLAAKQFLDEKGLIAFIKTSGQTGMHIFLPCEGIEYGEARKIGETIANEIHNLVPNITTVAALKKNRNENLYIDPSQNDFADRMASAYCVRSFEAPNVSTPLEWSEVKNGLHPNNFSLKSIFERIKSKGDIWTDLFIKEYQLKNARKLKEFI